ncbi:spore germination protein GerPE [Ectobacillus antri]|uniref:Spore germination protein GerPE n=1 Tax=Ectobacillus antri TaxID=2486280 RepID=A0ABT6H3U6_9BACI|nr:spore germination protein GerPE [Ectobacillus antri]MDG4656709.1 spore germination protein GerPE [Ectobacillus antri]MDG5753928.1 spore germination protein GerPE [Ectobacillus antri]
MFRRFSVVQDVTVLTMGISSVIQIGDTNTIETRTRAIAVQDEKGEFIVKDPPFSSYIIFRDTDITIPLRVKEARMHVINACPFIHVDSIFQRNMLNSSCLHIGSLDYGFANSRIVQIRKYAESSPSEKDSI